MLPTTLKSNYKSDLKLISRVYDPDRRSTRARDPWRDGMWTVQYGPTVGAQLRELGHAGRCQPLYCIAQAGAAPSDIHMVYHYARGPAPLLRGSSLRPVLGVRGAVHLVEQCQEGLVPKVWHSGHAVVKAVAKTLRVEASNKHV
eukprot:scaffold1204_cov407-Prasinococcus_capsulatus_cf.AAC.15